MFLPFTFCAWPLSAQNSTNALPRLAPAYPEMPPTFWEQHGTTVLVGGVIFLAFVALVMWQILKPRPKPVLPPEILAREALAQLQRQPEDGQVLSDISQVLRRYVSTAFDISAGELTTAEFSAALAGSEKIGAELAQAVSSFLRECDERKFSPASATAPLNAAARALELVERAGQRVRSAPVPVAATAPTQNAAANQQPHTSSDVAASGDGRTP